MLRDLGLITLDQLRLDIVATVGMALGMQQDLETAQWTKSRIVTGRGRRRKGIGWGLVSKTYSRVQSSQVEFIVWCTSAVRHRYNKTHAGSSITSRWTQTIHKHRSLHTLYNYTYILQDRGKKKTVKGKQDVNAKVHNQKPRLRQWRRRD